MKAGADLALDLQIIEDRPGSDHWSGADFRTFTGRIKSKDAVSFVVRRSDDCEAQFSVSPSIVAELREGDIVTVMGLNHVNRIEPLKIVDQSAGKLFYLKHPPAASYLPFWESIVVAIGVPINIAAVYAVGGLIVFDGYGFSVDMMILAITLLILSGNLYYIRFHRLTENSRSASDKAGEWLKARRILD